MPMTLGRLAVVLTTTVCLFVALAPGSPLGVWPGTALAAVIALFGAVLTARRELTPLLRPGSGAVALGLAYGGLMAAATHLVYPLVARLPGVSAQVAALYALLESEPGPGASLPIVLLVVSAEELVWRGILYGWLRSRMGTGAAVAIATVLYAVPQLGGRSWVLLATALACGAVWTVQRARSRNLIVPLVTHLTWDLLVMVAFPLI